jgi:hypothetical protein
VSAHTSAGKTVVAEYSIAMALRDKQVFSLPDIFTILTILMILTILTILMILTILTILMILTINY